MYLSNTTEKLQLVLGGAITTSQLNWITSYQDITSAGMTLPQSSSQGNSNNTTDVDMVAAPSASTTRQIVHLVVYNADTAAATVTIKKDISGTDYIYVKQTLQAGDTLQWSREDGFIIISGTSQARYTFTTFTANGTYTKPAGLKSALIFASGAGGGGGSGARNAAGTNRFGGGGGAGAAIVWQLVDAASLAATVSVTVGTAGTGAAGITVDTTNGTAGTAGGDTSFGAIVIAKGGGGGGGGTTASGGSAGAGGLESSSVPAYGPTAWRGATGASGVTNGIAGAGGTGLGGFTAASGGGGGAGINSTNVSGTSAGGGGSIYQNGVLIAGPSSGASPNGVNNASVFLHMNTTLTSGTGLGTGGAGGYPGFVNGGSAGYGAGGGGGSGSLNGTTSGAGGNGGGGFVIVMNIF